MQGHPGGGLTTPALGQAPIYRRQSWAQEHTRYTFPGHLISLPLLSCSHLPIIRSLPHSQPRPPPSQEHSLSRHVRLKRNNSCCHRATKAHRAAETFSLLLRVEQIQLIETLKVPRRSSCQLFIYLFFNPGSIIACIQKPGAVQPHLTLCLRPPAESEALSLCPRV